MILYTLDAAFESEFFSNIIVTTDSPEIQDVVVNNGYNCPFLRPPELAADNSPLIHAIQHALSYMEHEGISCSSVCVLQPTSPFRQADHIREACRKFEEEGCKTLVSVMRVPHRFVPESLMIQKGAYLKNLLTKSVAISRHDDKLLWARNGPAILISDAKLIRRGTFYAQKIVGYQMDAIASIDIDEEEDWALAEKLIEND